MQTMKRDRGFEVVDLVKFIMAFVVIAIHTNPIADYDNPNLTFFVVMIEEWAVPFFFIASGFFLFYYMPSSKEKQLARIDNYLRKIAVMYSTWTLFSFPLTVYGYVESGNSWITCILSYVKYFFFVGKLYNSHHLWYLLALIYALAVIRFMWKRNAKRWYFVAVAFLLYTMSEIFLYLMGDMQELSGISYKLVYLYQYVFNKGGVFTGMIYVTIGMLIALTGKFIDGWLAVCLIGGIRLLKLISADIINDYLMLVEAMLFFMAVVSISNLKKWGGYVILRRYSTIIYVSHLIFYSFYTFVIIRQPNKLGLDSFVITSVLCLFNAVFLTWLMNRRGFAWLRKIV